MGSRLETGRFTNSRKKPVPELLRNRMSAQTLWWPVRQNSQW